MQALKKHSLFNYLIMFSLLIGFLVIIKPAFAVEGGLNVILSQPESTLDNQSVTSVVYQVYNKMDPDNVYFQWDFSKGLDIKNDVENYMSLVNVDTGESINLDDGTGKFSLINGVAQEGDFTYTKQGKKPNKIRRLELNKVLDPKTNYKVTFDKDFVAKNGADTLGQTYSWSFATNSGSSGSGGETGSGNGDGSGNGSGANNDGGFTVNFSIQSTSPSNTVLQFDFSKGANNDLSSNLGQIQVYKEADNSAVTYSDYKYIKKGSKSEPPKIRRILLTFDNLESGVTYDVKIKPGFTANNGTELGISYNFEFTTSGSAILSGQTEETISKSNYEIVTKNNQLKMRLKGNQSDWYNLNLNQVTAQSFANAVVTIPKDILEQGDESKELHLSLGDLQLEMPVKEIKVQNTAKQDVSIAVNEQPAKPVVKEQHNESFSNVGGLFELKVMQGDKNTLENQNSDINVKKSIDVSQLTDKQKEGLGLYRYDEETQTWIYKGGNLQDGKLVGTVNQPGVYGVLSYDKQFSDLKNHWAVDDIESMVRGHLAYGVSPEKFEPNKPVTRAQFMVFLGRILKLEPSNTASKFKDVKKGTWYTKMVNAVAEKGLVKGSDGMLKPNQTMTRQEVAAMMVRTLDLMGKSVKEKDTGKNEYKFDDDNNISSWASSAVYQAKELGLMNGRGNKHFAPQSSVTRAEAAVILKRAL